jgi:precorrin-8X/cobalt-precorrin-8 methylmutase
LSRLPPLSRAVTERIIHATADFDYATDLVTDEAGSAGPLAGTSTGTAREPGWCWRPGPRR